MAKSQETFNKKEKEKKRAKKRQEKQQKKEERKLQPKVSGFDNMIAYADEYGNTSSTPPDPTKKSVVVAKNIEVSIPKRSKDETPSVLTGIVEFFNDAKGFGFIREKETKMKYFVHVHGLVDEIIEGNLVTFELERGMKGMNAVKVKKV